MHAYEVRLPVIENSLLCLLIWNALNITETFYLRHKICISAIIVFRNKLMM